MKIETFKKGLKILLTVFPDKKIDSEIYWEFLKDLKGEDYLKAVTEISSTQTELYPGTNLIAMIREKALVGDGLTNGEAWREVIREISNTGSWGEPHFKNPLVTRAVECMGWRTLCLSEDSALDRAHFLKIYNAIKKRNDYNQLAIGSDKKLLPGKAGELVKKVAKEKDAS